MKRCDHRDLLMLLALKQSTVELAATSTDSDYLPYALWSVSSARLASLAWFFIDDLLSGLL